ncbi:hypothetical protein [Algoriphagus sp. PAP.12]|uniref:hypothetical protein n=1 Tax=Algoriphagus sp. PAP.12 TaxID=2996678 RepID=UPI00227D5AEF|nr:hypothetical protein [Algoriphagus sp. PAP.12]
MKKFKSILSLTLALTFFSTIGLTSCGGKKDKASENTEEVNEHPSDNSEHPTEHPTSGDSTEHPSN